MLAFANENHGAALAHLVFSFSHGSQSRTSHGFNISAKSSSAALQETAAARGQYPKDGLGFKASQERWKIVGTTREEHK